MLRAAPGNKLNIFKLLMSSTVVMRIGKKSKEGESRSQVVDGINRLICTSKSQSHPLTGFSLYPLNFFQRSRKTRASRILHELLKTCMWWSISLSRSNFLKIKLLLFSVTIDGVDWNGVKFFQLSAQWQTHIKHIPLITFTTENTAL